MFVNVWPGKAYPVYLYGSRADVLKSLRAALASSVPTLRIVGAEPSRFRTLSVDEQRELAARIDSSGARLVIVGLGCPRQEVWVYEMREHLHMPLLAVGAAFDFVGGTQQQAPPAMQRYGLEWLFRLSREPRRLWRRYLLLNPWYVAAIALQWVGVRQFDSQANIEPAPLRYG